MLEELDYKPHCFTMGHTIEAIIKLYNRQDLSKDELAALMIRFNDLNNNELPTMGVSFKIPLLRTNEAQHGNCQMF